MQEQGITISDSTRRALAMTDDWPADMRACVHEFGFAIVYACVSVGVTKPNTIRALVREIWEGARQQHQRTTPTGTLEWLMIQNGGVPLATLARVLDNKSLVIVSREPTRAMIAASMAEVSGFTERITKQEKHTRRLRAAIKAGAIGLK